MDFCLGMVLGQYWITCCCVLLLACLGIQFGGHLVTLTAGWIAHLYSHI